MDPPGHGNQAEIFPNQPSTQQKRNASSPLEQSRTVRPRHEQETDNEASNLATTSGNGPNAPTINIADNNTGEASANDNTPGSAINNTYFPTFKLLRKINNKLVTANTTMYSLTT